MLHLVLVLEVFVDDECAGRGWCDVFFPGLEMRCELFRREADSAGLEDGRGVRAEDDDVGHAREAPAFPARSGKDRRRFFVSPASIRPPEKGGYFSRERPGAALRGVLRVRGRVRVRDPRPLAARVGERIRLGVIRLPPVSFRGKKAAVRKSAPPARRSLRLAAAAASSLSLESQPLHARFVSEKVRRPWTLLSESLLMCFLFFKGCATRERLHSDFKKHSCANRSNPRPRDRFEIERAPAPALERARKKRTRRWRPASRVFLRRNTSLSLSRTIQKRNA